MRYLEVRRHSKRSRPNQHLTQWGVALARGLGSQIGPFDRVVTSPLPRCVETAVAMGFAVDETIGQLAGDDRLGESFPAMDKVRQTGETPEVSAYAFRLARSVDCSDQTPRSPTQACPARSGCLKRPSSAVYDSTGWQGALRDLPLASAGVGYVGAVPPHVLQHKLVLRLPDITRCLKLGLFQLPDGPFAAAPARRHALSSHEVGLPFSV